MNLCRVHRQLMANPKVQDTTKLEADIAAQDEVAEQRTDECKAVLRDTIAELRALKAEAGSDVALLLGKCERFLGELNKI
jgi:hypothetical protein